MLFKVGTMGAMEDFINEVNVLDILPCWDGKIFVKYEGEKAPIGEPIIKEVIKEIEVEVIKEVIKEVEKIVEVDNPEIAKQLAKCQEENKKLKAKIAKLIAE